MMMAYQRERIFMGGNEQLDSWDPARDDYTNRNFNSYDRGPGRNLIGRKHGSSKGITLYVQNLPMGISDDGLRNIFLHSGCVLSASVKISRIGTSECQYGFVEMSTLREAETAISELNGFPIGNNRLKVEIALSKEEKEARARKREEDEAFLQQLNYGRSGSSVSDHEGRSQKAMMNGHGGRKGRGRAGRLEELTDTETMEPRPGRHLNPNPQAMHNGTFGGRPTLDGGYQSLGNPMQNSFPGAYDGPQDMYPGNMRSGYQGGYSRDSTHMESLLLDRGHGFNQYVPQMNFPGVGMGRGIAQGGMGFRRGAGGNPWYGRGRGYAPGGGRGYNSHPYGRGSSFGGCGDVYSPHGRGFGQPHGMGRGFNQTFTAPELYRENSGYFTDTERFQRQRERPGKRILPPKPCLNCKQPGSLRCARCKMPYCSENCQTVDWPKHKPICRELSQMGSANLDELEERFDVAVDDSFLDVCSNIGGKTRSPRKGADSSSEGSKYSDDSRGGRGSSRRGRGSKVNGYQSRQKEDEKHKPQTLAHDRKPPGGPRKTSPANQHQGPMGRQQTSRPGQREMANQPMQSRLFFKNMKAETLPLKTPVQVVVTHVETPSRIWVQPAIYDQLRQLEELMIEVSEHNQEVVSGPMIGEVYAAQFDADKKWYRVKVTALQAPDTVCIFYFDFGNTATVTYSQLRPLTKAMTQLPVQAIHCSISDVFPVGKDWDSDCLAALKKMLPEMDVFVFQADGRDQKGCHSGHFFLTDGPSVKDRLIQMKVAKSSVSRLMVANMAATAEGLQIGQEFQVYIVFCTSPGNFSAQILEDSRVENFRAMMDDLVRSQVNTQPSKRIPEVGEFVIAKFSYDDKWYRAEVTAVQGSKVKVLFIDYGNSEEVDKENIRAGTDRFTSLPVQCVTCFLHGVTSPEVLNWPAEVTTWLKKLITGATLRAVVKSKIGKSLGVELFSTDNKPLSLSLKEELLKAEQGSSANVTEVQQTESLPLDGSLVDVTIFEVISCQSFYLQKDQIADQSALYSILVALNAMDESPPYATPSHGEIVAAQFSEDKSWYRAFVKEVTTLGCKVHFIDYGNGETVPLDKVRRLDRTLASYPGRAIQCGLSGVPSDSVQHKDLLNMYKNTKVQVKAVSEHSGVYEVVVILQGNQCLNEITLPLETTNPQSAAAPIGKVRVYTLEEVALSTPPAGKLPVMVTSVENPASLYCQIVADDVKQAAEILTNNMALYYKEETTPASDPQANQLYCVQFEDVWYRCVVLERKSVAVRVFLLDYGTVEEVSVSDLRPMKSEFLELKALAVKCALYGIAPIDDTWSKAAIESVKRIEGQELLMVLRGKNGDVYEGTLTDPGDETIEVGAILVAQNLAKSAAQSPVPSTDPPILPAHIKKAILPSDGTEVEAVCGHIQDFNQIYLQLIPGAIDAINLVQAMNEVCMRSVQTLKPGKGEMVCALFEGDWYRARVDGVKDTNCRVFFVDYGNFDNVPFTSIKKMNAEFSKLPMQAIHCNLAGVSIQNNKEQLQNLKTVLSRTSKLDVKVVEVKNEVFIVQIRVGEQIINDLFEEETAPVTDGTASPQLRASSPAGQRSLQSLMCATLPTDGTPVSTVAADVQGFSSVYLQSMEGFQEVNELMGKLNTRCCDTSNPTIVPKVGDIISACFSVDNVWYRARVVDLSTDSCSVVFIDYGNADTLPFSKIKKLDAEFLDLPCQAIKCKLEGVIEINDPNKLDILQKMISGKPLSVKANKKVDDIYMVEIYVNDENINDVFRPAQVEDKNSEKLPPLTNAIMLQDRTVDAVASYIESFESIYIQTIEGLETLCDMMAEMSTQCANNSTTHNPVVGEYVSAFLTPDNAWYRARVDEVGATECKVYFVDYGNSATVPLSLIKKLDQQFRVFPCQGMHCSLDGVDIKDDPEKLDQLHQMITNVKLTVRMVGTKNDVHSVSISVNEKSINDHFRNVASPAASVRAAMLQFAELPMYTPLEAVATHIEDFDSIFIQTLEGGKGLTPIMENLMHHCITSSDTAKDPAVGDIVCACFGHDSIWYRARVEEVTDTTCKVFFLDYGNYDVVPLTEVKKMPEELIAYPIQGIQCCLANVSSRKDMDKLAKLNECIGNVLITVKAVDRKGQIPVVEIYTGENLVNNIFREPTSEVLEVPKVAELPADGTAIEAMIVHMHDFDCIYVQTFEGGTALIEVMKEINVHCTNSSTSLIPGVGDLVCALFSQDNTWYRARVDEITIDGIKVVFVDYGNTDLVAPASIMKLESQFRSLPIQGIRCSLSNVDVRNNPEKLVVLQEKTHEKKLTLKAVGKENDVYCVEMKVDDEVINHLFCPIVKRPLSVSIPTDGSSVDAVATDIQDFDAIFVQTVEGGTALITLMNELNEVCRTDTDSVVPSVGDHVSAWFDQDRSWYRARVDDVTETHCKVFFTDYGNSDEVELSRVKKLDAKFADFPLQAVRCSLAGVDIRSNPEELLKLGENIADKKLTVTASSVMEGVYQVEITVDDGKKSINGLFQSQSPVDEEAEAIRRQIEELQLKLAAKTKQK